MNYNIVTYPQFEKELKRLAKKYKSLKSVFATFLQELWENPNEGAQLGHGLRKVRLSIASKGKGKSGGKEEAKNLKLASLFFYKLQILSSTAQFFSQEFVRGGYTFAVFMGITY